MAFQAQIAVDQPDLRLVFRTVGLDDDHLLVGTHGAPLDTANTDSPDIAVVIQVGNLHLERRIGIHFGWRTVPDNRFKQRRHVTFAYRIILARIPVDCGSVNDGKVELFVSCTKAIKEFKDLIDDPVGSRSGLVDLVDDNDWPEAVIEGFLGHEARLWHGAFLGINEQQDGIDHREYALDLTAKVGMAGGVDYIDAVVVPADCRVLGKNRDATLFLEIVGIHDTFDLSVAVTECS